MTVRITTDRLVELEQPLLADHEADLDAVRTRLDRRGVDVEAVVAEVARFSVAAPSWALGTGGTRFGRFPGGGAGQLGCGTLIIAGIVSLLFGTDLGQTIAVFDSVDQATNGGQATGQVTDMSEQEVCTQNQYATEACNALDSLNRTWQPAFADAGIRFQQPFLYLLLKKHPQLAL